MANVWQILSEPVQGYTLNVPPWQVLVANANNIITFTTEPSANIHTVQFSFTYPMPSEYGNLAIQTPVPVGATLSTGFVGISYHETISVSGGTSPYTFSIIDGSLPIGLSLGSSTGNITGTPSSVSTTNFTIQVEDTNSETGSQEFAIVVQNSSGTTVQENWGWVN
ncbi:Uncharacterised protein [uncultured archaeon]|nr:Uncharacterised protein [uncultured archaeon]